MNTMQFRIKYSTQCIENDDKLAVLNALESSNLTQGKFVEQFEVKLSKYTQSKYCTVVSNASVALKIAYESLGVGPGDAVWVSNNTFASTATAALSCGATVVPLEISLDTFTVDLQILHDNLKVASEKNAIPKVITVVDFGGLPSASVDLKKLSEIYGFKIVVDSAHGIGSWIGDIPTGANSYSDITVFSFHAIKVITTGEGGALTTNDQKLAKRIQSLRSHGIASADARVECEKMGELWNYDVFSVGYNFRLTDIQCALGISQLDKLDRFVEARHKLISVYRDHLDERFDMQKIPRGYFSAYHLNVVLTPVQMKKTKREVFNHFAEKQIQLNYHYIPIHRLNLFERINGKIEMPISNEYFQRAISLPLHQTLMECDVIEICQELNTCM